MDELSAFGSLGERLGFRLHLADVRAMAALSGRLGLLGVTPARATAVVYVALHEGCDQVALGRALGINRASTMKAIDDLQALGAIERRSGRDRRSNALHLTAAGRLLRQEIERATKAHDDAAFAALSGAEQAELRRLLGKLRLNDDDEAAAVSMAFSAPAQG